MDPIEPPIINTLQRRRGAEDDLFEDASGQIGDGNTHEIHADANDGIIVDQQPTIGASGR
ncbi:hypothetical protein N2603_14670 [Bradyrhizobium huanghuaihaiense]|uniref:hypothetical protein n=1 Tax=Bradyrhizobium huanghuaihaiense TaxID=990078 RepID=UPI0021AAFFBB|nr:hypothetical protein [Bradyrhizobium sp. CB3035]UWU79653.1 hypothetical protein N2603_14670 [Bradyrhizobium sp. CB3035]